MRGWLLHALLLFAQHTHVAAKMKGAWWWWRGQLVLLVTLLLLDSVSAVNAANCAMLSGAVRTLYVWNTCFFFSAEAMSFNTAPAYCAAREMDNGEPMALLTVRLAAHINQILQVHGQVL